MRPGLRPCLFALGLAVASLGASPILANPATVDAKTLVTAPNWVMGSNWYYSDGYALKVSAVSPEATTFDRLDAPGQWFSRQGFLRKDLASSTATRTSIYRTVPDQAGMTLQPGKPLTFQREYLENGALIVHASSWSVEGRETITVPAGTFDCFVIVWRTRSLRSNWTGFERWWYSPKAQNYVRMEYKYGPDDEGSRVLMRYQIGTEAAIGNLPAAAAAIPAAKTEPVVPAALPTVPPVAPQPVRAAAETSAPALLPADPVPAPVMTANADPVPKSNAAAETPALLPADPVPPIMAVNAAPDPKPAAAAEVTAPALLPADPVPMAVADANPAAEPKPAASDSAPAEPEPAHSPAPAPKTKSADVDPQTGAWHAQIMASQDEAAARKGLDKILHSHAEILKDVPSGVAAAPVSGKGMFYRAWVGQFASAAEARGFCDTLKTGGVPCTISKTHANDVRISLSKL